MNGNRRKIIFLSLIMSTAFLQTLQAEDEIYGEVGISTGSENTSENLIDIDGRLGYIMDLPKKMEAKIAVRVNEFELNPDEITIKFKIPGYFNIKVGYNENFMTFEESVPSFERSINTVSLLTEYFKYLGYVSRYISASIYHNYDSDKSKHPFSWYVQGGMSMVILYLPQFEGGFFYHPFGEDSRLGLMGIYQLDQIGNKNEFYNYFAFTAVFTDMRGPLIYGFETAFGKNNNPPISFFPLPSGEGKSFFWGMDIMIGWKQGIKDMAWIPALRYCLLIPDVSEASYLQHYLLLANQFYLSKKAKFFFDTGIEHTRPYLGLSGKDNEFKWKWSAGIQVATDGVKFRNLFQSKKDKDEDKE